MPEIRISQSAFESRPSPGAGQPAASANATAASPIRGFLLSRGNSAMADRGFHWRLVCQRLLAQFLHWLERRDVEELIRSVEGAFLVDDADHLRGCHRASSVLLEGKSLSTMRSARSEPEDAGRDGAQSLKVEPAGKNLQLPAVFEDVEPAQVRAVFADQIGPLGLYGRGRGMGRLRVELAAEQGSFGAAEHVCCDVGGYLRADERGGEGDGCHDADFAAGCGRWFHGIEL